MSPKAVIRIGRGEDCDVRFDAHRDTRVSNHHAEIRFEGGRYVVVDVGSSNGTFVNGKLVRTHALRSGDKIVFGAQGGPEVRFEVEESFRPMRSSGREGRSCPPAAPLQSWRSAPVSHLGRGPRWLGMTEQVPELPVAQLA